MTQYGNQIWRRRRCLDCLRPFTSYERPDLSYLRIIDQTGKHRSYSRAKLYASVYLAFSGTNHRPATIDAATDTLEAKLMDLGKDYMAVSELTYLILSVLKRLHPNAFLRYLSTHTELPTSHAISQSLKDY